AKLRPTQYTRRTGKVPPPRTGTRTGAGAGITSVIGTPGRAASVRQGVHRLVDDAVLGLDHGAAGARRRAAGQQAARQARGQHGQEARGEAQERVPGLARREHGAELAGVETRVDAAEGAVDHAGVPECGTLGDARSIGSMAVQDVSETLTARAPKPLATLDA